MQTDGYQAPQLTPEQATPQRVREEFVNCIVTAFGSANRMPHASPNPIQMRNDAERFVRRAFEDAGARYEEPTTAALRAVLDQWREKAGGFVSDAAMIQHHWNEMNKLVNQIA